ncbi:MAG TPA: hypothetical protein VG432_05425 [Gemmatimonadaceae bacterium]|nr:hypothetical protein [Gemmatimonadaceae bacterium]
MHSGPSNQTSRRFDDKKGQWWAVSWRDAEPARGRSAGYVFRAADGDEELFLEGGPGAGPDRLAQMSLGDVRQILSVARSGLV